MSGGGVCELLGAELSGRLDELEAKGLSGLVENTSVLLIVDRSFDWVTLLAHDMTYEPLVFDVLEREGSDIKESVYFSKDDDKSQGTRLDESDSQWVKYRHMPIWQVNDAVIAGVREVAKKEQARQSAKSSAKTTEALNDLHRLPEEREQLAKLQLHSEICQRCFRVIEDKLLAKVGEMEQNIATGKDAEGFALQWGKVEKQLVELLANPGVTPESKARLLLLFFLTADSFSCPSVRRMELVDVARLAGPHRRAVLSLLGPGVMGSDSSLASSCAALSMEVHPQAAPMRRWWKQGFSNHAQVGSPRSAKLRRVQPRLRKVMEAAAKGTLDGSDFTEVPAQPSSLRGVSKSFSEPCRHIIVFVVGGVSLPEARAAHEIASALNSEVFIGGSCMLTPGLFFETLAGC